MVQVKEGYISKADLKIIKQQVVNNNNFPWYYYQEHVYGFQKNHRTGSTGNQRGEGEVSKAILFIR